MRKQRLGGSRREAALAVRGNGSTGMDDKWTSGKLKETTGSVGQPASMVGEAMGGHTASKRGRTVGSDGGNVARSGAYGWDSMACG
ncbi:hypothetical protein NL676_008967 [Syzygium grande]|nr:hypothetical protein NL676_008967 [Syzygium grande]